MRVLYGFMANNNLRELSKVKRFLQLDRGQANLIEKAEVEGIIFQRILITLGR